MTRHRIERDGVGLSVWEEGPADGEGVLLLHGWPDSSAVWRHQVPALAEAGYRVVVPDQRGFGRSDRPTDVEAYKVREAVTDAVTVLGSLGLERAHVVGHDWGAAVSWALAAFLPQVVRSLVVLAVGHPGASGQFTMAQHQASWYMWAFQVEGVAEDWITRDDWAEFRRFVDDHPEAEQWITELSREGALTASLNWYRANQSPATLLRSDSPMPTVSVPTLGVAGSDDFALTPLQMQTSAEQVDAEWRYELLEGIGHWIPLDAPDRLTDLLLEWLPAH